MVMKKFGIIKSSMMVSAVALSMVILPQMQLTLK